jgi:hypothetical protein
MSFRYSLCAMFVLVVFPLSVSGSMITLWIDSGFGSTEDAGVSAVVILSFSEEGTEDLMAVSLGNTTPTSLESRLTAVGLEIPDSLSVSLGFADGGESTYFDVLTFDDSVSPGWIDAPGGYDLMITSDGAFEGGNPIGAPASGQSQTVVLALGDTGMTPGELAGAFADYYAGLNTNHAVGRFQSVGSGDLSDKVLGRVPEPGAVSLWLLGATVISRRRLPF